MHGGADSQKCGYSWGGMVKYNYEAKQILQDNLNKRIKKWVILINLNRIFIWEAVAKFNTMDKSYKTLRSMNIGYFEI